MAWLTGKEFESIMRDSVMESELREQQIFSPDTMENSSQKQEKIRRIKELAKQMHLELVDNLE